MKNKSSRTLNGQTVTVAVTVIMSAILSSPSILYLIKKPSLTSLLSFFVSIGFYFFIVFLVRNTFIQILIGLPVMLLNIIEIIHIAVFGGLISIGGVEGILFTDPYEAKEFLFDWFPLIFLFLAVVAGYIFLAITKTRLDVFTLRVRTLSAIMMLSGPAIMMIFNILMSEDEQEVFFPVRIFEHYTKYIGLNPVSNTISGLANTISYRRRAEDLIEKRKGFLFNSRRAVGVADSALYIVVIGESSRRRNWSLYGYKRPTTPNLSAIHNLIAFKDVISPGVTTCRSVPVSFSLATPDSFQIFYQTRSLISAFGETGFWSCWISNQGQFTTVDTPTSLIMKEADDMVSTNFGFWNASLDEKMLPELKKAVDSPYPEKIIVLHTLGSHTNYKQRFPKGFDLSRNDVSIQDAHTWDGINSGEADIIDSYDKTVAYTDWLLSEIIKIHDNTGLYGAVVYFSDHGQRLYDNAERQKGHGFPDCSRYDVDIPFFVWLSDKFAERNPDMYKTIQNNAEKPVSNSDFIYSMLDLAGIRTDYNNSARSFFNEQYQVHPRRISDLNMKRLFYDDLPKVQSEDRRLRVRVLKNRNGERLPQNS